MNYGETEGTQYTVHFTGDINGDYEIFLQSAGTKVYLVGKLNSMFTKMQGTIKFTKDNLEVVEANAELKGLTFAKIAPLPIPLPIPYLVDVDADLSEPFPILIFPLNVGDYWSMPSLLASATANAGL